MLILLNGSFGVGKSTVARLLRSSICGSAVYDPEWAGSILMRLPQWVNLKGTGTTDFQDIDLWRKLTIQGVRLVDRTLRRTVIVPMTFDRTDYFEEVVTGLRRFDPDIRIFCLKANFATIRARLGRRGVKNAEEAQWLERRILECEKAHRSQLFGEPIETGNHTPQEVADVILAMGLADISPKSRRARRVIRKDL